MRIVVLALVLPLALAARDRGPPAAVPAGPPQNCIPIAQIDRTLVRDDRTIDFTTRLGPTYRNVLPARCPQLGFERRFGYETSLTQLCSTDFITVLATTPPIRGASCGLGPFQPVRLAPPR